MSQGREVNHVKEGDHVMVTWVLRDLTPDTACLSRNTGYSFRGLQACFISVESESDRRGLGLHCFELVCGESGSSRGHRVTESCLMGRDRIGIPLNHQRPALSGDALCRVVQPVQQLGLLVEVSLGTIQILGPGPRNQSAGEATG